MATFDVRDRLSRVGEGLSSMGGTVKEFATDVGSSAGQMASNVGQSASDLLSRAGDSASEYAIKTRDAVVGQVYDRPIQTILFSLGIACLIAGILVRR